MSFPGANPRRVVVALLSTALLAAAVIGVQSPASAAVTLVVNTVAPNLVPGTGGTPILVTGSGLSGVSNVDVGPTRNVGFTKVSDSQLVVISPGGTTGTALVQLTTTDLQTASIAIQFSTPTGPPPVVSGINPPALPLVGGGTASVSGSNLSPGSTVYVGSVPAAVLGSNGTGGAVSVAVRGGLAAGYADVTVVNPDGQSATLPQGLQYLAPTPGPNPAGIAVTAIVTPDGQLSLSCNTTSVSLGALTRTAILSSATVSAGRCTVVDGRSARPGFTVTAISTPLTTTSTTGPNSTINPYNVALDVAAVAPVPSGVTVRSAVPPSVPLLENTGPSGGSQPPGLGGAAGIVFGAPGAAAATVDLGVSVVAPAVTQAGTYTGTITITALGS